MPHIPVFHPSNGTVVFGTIPEKNSKGVLVPSGHILLKRGRHRGNTGFGVRHIWERHELELIRKGYVSETYVARFVAGITAPGAEIFGEFERIRDIRITVLRRGFGAAVLEYKADAARPHYSVVTAFTPRYTRGIKIGEIEAAELPRK